MNNQSPLTQLESVVTYVRSLESQITLLQSELSTTNDEIEKLVKQICLYQDELSIAEKESDQDASLIARMEASLFEKNNIIDNLESTIKTIRSLVGNEAPDVFLPLNEEVVYDFYPLNDETVIPEPKKRYRGPNLKPFSEETLRHYSEAQLGLDKPKPNIPTSSKYKGVSWCKAKQKYEVAGTYFKKKTFIGYFEDEIEAAQAYDKWALETKGPDAVINFREVR